MHIAENTHWYDAAGKPAYTVIGKNGKERATTLRDARTMALVPSVTTIIKSAAAPALERWKQTQVLHAALTLPLIAGETEEAYLSRIWQDSREQGKKAAERGTAIHAAVQGHYEGKPPEPEYWPHVKGTAEAVGKWADAHPTNASWDAERSFSHRFGFGGKCDLSCDGMVADFKTKEFDADTKLQTWDEHCMQLAAYRVGLGMPQARCAIVYVSVTVPGLARVIELSQDDLKQGWGMFQGLLAYWQEKHQYWPTVKAAA